MFKSFRILARFAMFSILIAFSSFTQASSYDAELLRLTNAERQNAGLPALTLSSQLGQAAQNHAEDMANNNYFSHDGLNGSTAGDRIRVTGYSYRAWGENISVWRATPSETIQGWMNSEGHRKNILGSNFTEIGFGYAYSQSSDYGHYWVQVFGKSNSGSTSTPQPVQTPAINSVSFEFKVNAIFNLVEQSYAWLFFPSAITQTTGTGEEMIHYRLYNNMYQAGLATYQGNVFYALYDDWNRFGTLEEANQQLCNNQCWVNIANSNTSTSTGTGRIRKTGKTFVDTQTGLEWIADNITNKERDAAIAHCNALNYDGHQDWRLSTSNELSSFVTALNQSSVKPDYLGSSLRCLAGITTDGYIALTSKYGIGEPVNFTGHASVRCVR